MSETSTQLNGSALGLSDKGPDAGDQVTAAIASCYRSFDMTPAFQIKLPPEVQKGKTDKRAEKRLEDGRKPASHRPEYVATDVLDSNSTSSKPLGHTTSTISDGHGTSKPAANGL